MGERVELKSGQGGSTPHEHTEGMVRVKVASLTDRVVGWRIAPRCIQEAENRGQRGSAAEPCWTSCEGEVGGGLVVGRGDVEACSEA